MTMTTPPRDNLCREVSFRDSRDDDTANDGFNLEGYAAVFGQSTEIDSWEGTFTEEIRKGAFRKSLRERDPVMQFDHGRHPLIGSIPIASIKSLREDDEGLWVEARMTDNWLIEPVRMAIAEKNIRGMSFRFDVVKERWYDIEGKEIKDPIEISQLLWNPGDRGPLRRELVELRLHELGPVVFPAYTQTTVGVRAREVALQIERNRETRRQVQRDLATSAERVLDTLGEDEDLRTQVASVVLWGAAAQQGQREEVEPSTRDTQPSANEPVATDHSSTVTTPEDADDKRLIARNRLEDLRKYVDAIKPLETC